MFSCLSEMKLVWLFLFSCVELHTALDLLGAGEGPGSCPAPPFRGKNLNWPAGCPLSTPCCNEYGYCVTEAEWISGAFRDCNGLSNGAELPEEVIKLEAFYAAIEKGVIDDPNGVKAGVLGKEDQSLDTSTTTSSTEGPAVVKLLENDDILKEAEFKDIISGQGGGEVTAESPSSDRTLF